MLAKPVMQQQQQQGVSPDPEYDSGRSQGEDEGILFLALAWCVIHGLGALSSLGRFIHNVRTRGQQQQQQQQTKTAPL